MELGKKIKAIRIAEGLEREDMAQLVDIPRGTIRNYEQGVREPKGETLTKITNHERFKKYTFWLMTDGTLPESGQISPDFSILLECGVVSADDAAKRA
ncbi:helix-turn-helix domain-containing protein [Vibrio crassostreae]|uniref:helix-turn-helix domain-containing protein n=1 Tax=Vibrio crassostreae TaxID=246167 RepID=UPI00104934BE|nr:helix-turn-helix transcriptional regulator [Vibrio crassostreae]TCT60155.1 helix-turn-helix protein [Vibrio crassostreae]